ncbi:uncharacterized protein C1orf167 homolog [Gorilla gorilla gorilla]|uniref:uncharacterized protein C1orf167 homolog n=1 Tax=Gorilla gorilla gorilla TaxID=9595 RepID=UPI002445BFA4|nr:uncharacterized protein C1orf167 homolog [Gorilla gorilla gorilla]
MELRSDASHKENVSPKPEALPKPEQRRFWRSLGISLSGRHDQWVPGCQVERGGPAATPSPGAVLDQEPCRVQTNLASPGPRLGLALKDTTGQLVNSSFWQQSNLQSLARRRQGKAREFAIQQSNLSINETSSPHLFPEPGGSFGPRKLPWGPLLSQEPLARPSPCLRQSRLPAPGTPSGDFRPTEAFAPLDGHTQPGLRSWGGLGSWRSRLVGEPLTLEDLAVPSQNQTQAPSHAAVHQLLASVHCLAQEAARLRSQAPQEPPGAVQQDLWTGDGQPFSAHPQPSQPVLASSDGRRRRLRGHRETAAFLETPASLSDSWAHSKLMSPETTLGTRTEDSLNPEQGLPPAHLLGSGDSCSPWSQDGRAQRGDPSLPRGVGSRETDPCSSAFSNTAWGVSPKQKGEEGALREWVHREEERTTFHLSDTVPASSASKNKAQNIIAPESEAICWQLLSRCFRSWRHLVKRQREPAAAAVALGRWQLLRKGLQALWLREAQLEAAWGQYTKVLLIRSFREWRNLALQQKQVQPHMQAGPGSPPSRRAQGKGLSLGRSTVVDPAQRSRLEHTSPGSLREEERAQWLLSHPRQRTDSRHERVQILQALQLAVFFLWCQQKKRARQERETLQKATRATQRTGSFPQAWHSTAAGVAWVAPLSPQHQRAWLCRCFGAWQQFVQRGSRYRDHLADRRTGTLRKCLEQWVQMKQLRESDGAKVTQLSLCRQKAGREAVYTAGPGACGLGAVGQAQGQQEQGWGSLQDACRTLALCWALLLWKMRLFQRQWANSFFQGLQQQMLQRSLRWWHLRALGPDATASCTKTPSALEPLGSSILQDSLEKVPRAPTLPDTLQGSLLWAAGQRQQGQCLLLWQARAQQFQGTARWYQHTRQRRIFLSWSRWATAQGAWRELASHRAWARTCRAVLGLWHQRLLQSRLVKRWAQEQGWRLAQDALCHWHSCWQGQQFLHEKCQTWVQVHLQGLQKVVFRSWQQAAAHQRCTVTRPEQLLLQRVLEASAQSAVRGGVQRAIVTQLRPAELRRFLRTAQLRVRLGLPGAGKTCSCWTQATELVPPAPSLQCSLGGQRKPRGTAWAQRCREHSLCPAFQLWPQWSGQSSWVPGLPLWTRDQGPRAHSSPEPRARKAQSKAHKRRLGARSCRILEKQAQAHGSALLLALKDHDALGHQEEVPAAPVPRVTASRAAGFPAGQVPGGGMATLGGCPRGRAAGADPAQGVAPEMGLVDVVAADPATASGSAVTAAGRWAFKKWHQRLAARSPRRGAASSPRPWSKPGPKGPESGQEAAGAPRGWGLGAEHGAQLQL